MRVGLALGLIVGSALGARSVSAADMPGLPPPVPVEPVAPVSWLAAGWYLRGDIGYRFPTVGSVEPVAPLPNATGDEFSGGVTLSAGAGIKTEWLRTDFTLDYLAPTTYTGTVVAAGDTTAKVSGFTALFNGYFDLGTWYRLTPYIGAGAGAGYISLTDYQGPPPLGANGDNSEWKFVWAGMAGVGWAVSPNMIVDVGYRYLNLGNLRTASNAAGAMTFTDVAGHEVRIGLRWSLNDFRP
jgi:opacity protein-like surface antigen